jgi:hypothetical protein
MLFLQLPCIHVRNYNDSHSLNFFKLVAHKISSSTHLVIGTVNLFPSLALQLQRLQKLTKKYHKAFVT